MFSETCLKEKEICKESMLLNEPSFNNEKVSCIDSEQVIDGVFGCFRFTSTTEIDNISCVGKIELVSFVINEEEIICNLSGFCANENITLQF